MTPAGQQALQQPGVQGHSSSGRRPRSAPSSSGRPAWTDPPRLNTAACAFDAADAEIARMWDDSLDVDE